ncbi:MAG: HNH endonuclease [Myxococcales bacterium]
MLEAASAPDAHVAALANAAAILEWPLPRERDESVCHEAARAVDALLVRVARGRGALDLAVGEALDMLGSRVVQLGFSGLGDYARERLGIAASTAQKMVRFARRLRERPLLRAAVRTGQVTIRAAEAILPRALGEDEAAWVDRARHQTVRALQAEVRSDGVAGPDDDDETWHRTRARMSPEQRAVFDKAMDFAREGLCATAPRWELARGICEEYLGVHPPPEGMPEDAFATPGEELDAVKEWLETESENWAFLDRPEPVEVPDLDPDAGRDPRALDAEVRRLAELRSRWDEVFGHLAMLLRAMDGWRRVGFASFAHYCDERVGMGVRTVEQRAALERRLYEIPRLREAMRERRISYEKARLIARHAEDDSIDAWIERGEHVPCITLRRELQACEETQMCARGEVEVWAPRSVAALIALACSAARKAAGRWISTGECLARIAQHFIDVWEPLLRVRNTLHRKVLERDRFLCQVPGCSRAADHAHHIRYRSRGGSDYLSNLTSLCAVHHLQGVHMGRIRVSGSAPDRLRWEVATPEAWVPMT